MHRIHIIWTLCLYAAFLSLGCTISISGSTLVHVGYLYGTDVAGMSIDYTCSSLGYLAGSLLCALLFDRYNHELQLFLCTLTMGVFMMVQPWLPHLYMFYAASFMKAMAGGFIDSCGQSYAIKLWTGHRFKDPILQGAHSTWSLGAFIGPFIVGPFLVDLPPKIGIETNTTSNLTIIMHETSSPVSDDLKVNIDGIENVRYPYLIVGMIGCMVSTTYAIIFCFIKSVNKQETNNSGGTNESGPPSGETSGFKIPMLTLQFFFYFFYIWCESIPGGYIAAFVIEGLHWPVHKGPLLTSVFWGALGIGRILGAPMSVLFSPSTMIAFNIAVTTVAFLVMLFSSMMPEYVLWISVAAAGMGMSTTFASTILWTSNYITITGSIGSLSLIASSCGVMSAASLTGFLFQNMSHMWVVYLSLLAAIIHTVLFSVMGIFAKCHIIGINKSKELQGRQDNMNDIELTPSVKQI